MSVVDFGTALALVAEHGNFVGFPEIERLPLLDGIGRVLAQTITADADQPAFDRATRDGFAVRASEFATGHPLRIAGEVRAGEAWRAGDVAPGATIRIMTGAPVPAWADAVVMVEHVVEAEGQICLSDGRGLSAGENIVPRGAEAHAGDGLVPAWSRAGAAEIALAAGCGRGELAFFKRPTVAIVATGDELVELDVQPEPQQIRNSNSYAIAAMVEAAGGEARRLEIARDTPESVRERVQEGRKCNLLMLSGGVSMGEYDLVEEVLTELRAEFFFTGVRMQPGKPVVFGRLPERDGERGVPFFGLPGNPVSTQVTFACFAAPFLRAMGGERGAEPRFFHAVLGEDIAAKDGLTRLLPARISAGLLHLVRWQGSGDLAANARANCYAELLPGRDYSAGEAIRVLLR